MEGRITEDAQKDAKGVVLLPRKGVPRSQQGEKSYKEGTPTKVRPQKSGTAMLVWARDWVRG